MADKLTLHLPFETLGEFFCIRTYPKIVGRAHREAPPKEARPSFGSKGV